MQLIVLPLTLKDHPQTIATFWSQVDHPFAAADHIEVVLRRQEIVVVIKDLRGGIFRQPL